MECLVTRGAEAGRNGVARPGRHRRVQFALYLHGEGVKSLTGEGFPEIVY